MRTKDNKKDTPGVIAPPPLIYFVPLIAGLLLHWMIPATFLPGMLHLAIGLPLTGVGIFLMVWAVQTFRHAGTDKSVYKPTIAIVAEGPYRFTRNPMYLSITLVYTGISISFNALWPILLLPIVLLITQFGVINREERYLEQKFGKKYLRYKNKIRRWI